MLLGFRETKRAAQQRLGPWAQQSDIRRRPVPALLRGIICGSELGSQSFLSCLSGARHGVWLISSQTTSISMMMLMWEAFLVYLGCSGILVLRNCNVDAEGGWGRRGRLQEQRAGGSHSVPPLRAVLLGGPPRAGGAGFRGSPTDAARPSRLLAPRDSPREEGQGSVPGSAPLVTCSWSLSPGVAWSRVSLTSGCLGRSTGS